MPGGVALTTLPLVSDWVDLGDTIPATGYAVHMMTVITETGAGRACYLQMLDARDGEVVAFVLDPEMAAQMAWEMTGVVSGYSPGAFATDEDINDEEYDE